MRRTRGTSARDAPGFRGGRPFVLPGQVGALPRRAAVLDVRKDPGFGVGAAKHPARPRRSLGLHCNAPLTETGRLGLSWREWAYKRRLHTSESNRRAALPGWLHHDNQHRPHTALGNPPPITRCTIVSGQYT